MIKNKNDYQYYLECDRVALGRKKKKGLHRFFPLSIIDPIWSFEKLLRKYEFIINRNKTTDKLYRSILWFLYHQKSIKLGFSIPLNAFGPGLSIAHIGNIIVNGNARIGNNCRIHVGVNIGVGSGDKGIAKIGDNVYIGPGVKIVGDVYIANDVAIGANAVIVKSIDEKGITVAGVPAKKISDNGSKNLIINATNIVNKNNAF